MPRLAALLAAAVASLLAVPAHADSPYATPPQAPPPPVTPTKTHGIYYTEAIGAFTLRDSLAERLGDDGGLAVRLALGFRADRVAVEAWINPLIGNSDEMIAYGVGGKYLFPVFDHVDVYLRGQLGALTVDHPDGYGADARYSGSLSGRGFGVGSGITLKGKVPVLGFLFSPLFFSGIGPKCDAALTLDQGYDFYRVRPAPGRHSFDAQVTAWTIGFSFGHSW